MADHLSLRQSQEKTRASKTDQTIYSHHFLIPNAVTSKKIYFYKSGDPMFSGIRMAINRRTFKTFDSLLDDLSNKIPLPFGVRRITTPRGGNSVRSLSDLKDGQSYICSDQRKVKPINLEMAKRKQHPWFISKSFHRDPSTEQSRIKVSKTFYEDSPQSTGIPKKLIIFKNGDPNFRRNLVMNKQTVGTFDVLLNSITELMSFNVVQLYSTDGKKLETLYPVKNVLDAVVAAGREAYKPRKYDISKLVLPHRLPPMTNRVHPNSVSKIDTRFRNKWKITVRTGDLPTAGTTAQVHIVLYGDEGNSRIHLHRGGSHAKFQSGQKDVIIVCTVNTKNIGKLYKIRIGHNNTGKFPGWHCKSIHLQNTSSGKEYHFNVNSWMDRNKGDGEVCREMPVLENGKEVFPVTDYEIFIVTGDLWNGGTEANVYIVIYGKRGDTGSRQLLRSNNPLKFRKGQTDIFSLKAVHLGKPQKLVVGHDGLGAGHGWFLEKITIKDSVKGSKGFLFPCHRWLDQGEEDGKIARELYVADNFTFPAKHELELRRKEIYLSNQWAVEKWKFMAGRILQFYCKPIGKFIRLMPDGTVDATGEKDDHNALFEVSVPKKGIQVFSSVVTPNLALAIGHNHVIALEGNETLCELTIHPKTNYSVILESVQIPGQIIAFNSEGKPVVAPSKENPEIIKDFIVHVMNAFEDGAVLLLNTSLYQSLCITTKGACLGTGKQFKISYLLLHKVSPTVYMFESVQKPFKFIQMKNGKCDGQGIGDEFCQFRVQRNLENATISLESVMSPGMYLGLLPDGNTRPFESSEGIHTMFYPQAINRIDGPTDFIYLRYFNERLFHSYFMCTLYYNRFSSEPSELKEANERKLSPTVAKEKQIKSKSLGVLLEIKQEKSKKKTYIHSSLNEGAWGCIWLKIFTNNMLLMFLLIGISPDTWKVVTQAGEAGTKAQVSMWVCGDKSTAGPIILKESNNTNPFISNQTDEFQVTLIHRSNSFFISFNLQINFKNVGRVFKIRIAHDGSSNQSDLKLNKVWMEHLENGHILKFEADRWLSFHHDDGEILREFPVIREDTGKPIYPVMKYQVRIHTEHLENDDSYLPIYICIYGKRGDTGLRYLYTFDHSAKLEHGQVCLWPDHKVDMLMIGFFQLEAVSLGELQKVLLHTEANDKQPWFCEQVVIKEQDNNQLEYVFNCNRWFPYTLMDVLHTDIMIPLSEIHEEMDSSPLEIEQEIHEETDSNPSEIEQDVREEMDSGPPEIEQVKSRISYMSNDILLQVVSAVKSSPVYSLQLDESKDVASCSQLLVYVCYLDGEVMKEEDLFSEPLATTTRGEDVFRMLEALIKHELGWERFVRVEIHEETDSSPPEIEQEIREEKVSSPPEITQGDKWEVLVTTGNFKSAGTEATVIMHIYGDKGTSGPIVLGTGTHQLFKPQNTDVFQINPTDVGELYKIRIGHDNVGEKPGWFVDDIKMKEVKTGRIISIPVNRWLDETQDDEDVWREFPISKPGEKPLPVLLYYVHVFTGDKPEADTDDDVFINIFGERGDTGKRKLHKSQNSQIKFQKEQIDTFILEAVSVGILKKIVIGHDGVKAGTV
ncbi:lipoxygenase homology domain-containing protein 1-like [Leucoraja erinacea]|uniref:lipoxygenase homology domain-containing protein 1-like n=1 Tax=Leucoraja erinaceus TaxID=7782 RepID=UPI002454E4E2|nr:lipoxygenase homology domain-containing protein 1-like [Leucoraja erinacea]